MDNKNIIIILLVIIVILAAAIGVILLQQNSKQATKIKITSDDSQYGDGELSLKLTDLNNSPISKEIVNITITDSKGKVVARDVVKTNSKGNANVDLDLENGKYVVNVTYEGNKNYTGNSTTQDLTVKEEVKATAVVSSTSQSSSKSKYDINNLPPDNDPYPETNRYYLDEDHVIQEYEDGYSSVVDLKTGERHGYW